MEFILKRRLQCIIRKNLGFCETIFRNSDIDGMATFDYFPSILGNWSLKKMRRDVLKGSCSFIIPLSFLCVFLPSGLLIAFLALRCALENTHQSCLLDRGDHINMLEHILWTALNDADKE